MVFHLIDEPDLHRLQTGLLRIDGSKRPSFGAMRTAIAAASACTRQVSWYHTSRVVGAKALFRARPRAAETTLFGISATAGEGAVAKAGIFRVSDALATPDADEIGRSLASRGGATPVLTAAKTIKPGYTPRFEFRGRLAPGHYVYGIRLTAAMNPSRSRTLVSTVFAVGE